MNKPHHHQLLHHSVWFIGWLLLFSTHTQHQRPPLRIAIDIGHSPMISGARSARGISEYRYNHALGTKLHQQLKFKGFDSFLLTAGNLEMNLKQRASLAKASADLLISIHHDSVQPHYLDIWQYQGKRRRYSDKFQGYSVFVSRLNPAYQQSYQFAQLLAQGLYQQGLRPTLHHAEPIAGENRPLLDTKLGIYQYDELIIVRQSDIPAVLLECGVLVNRQEELRMSDPKIQQQFIDAIINAIQQYLKQNKPPTME